MHVFRTTLARGPIAHVERGDDGHLHLHVGPLSVRLNPSAAASVSRTLAEAVEILELELASPARPAPARACASNGGRRPRRARTRRA